MRSPPKKANTKGGATCLAVKYDKKASASSGDNALSKLGNSSRCKMSSSSVVVVVVDDGNKVEIDAGEGITVLE